MIKRTHILRPTGHLEPFSEDNAWSCYGVFLDIGKFLEPTPHCWTCHLEDRKTSHLWGAFDYDDLNVIVCESHPRTGTSQKIVFDYWHDTPPAGDYSDYLKNHPDQGHTPNIPFSSADCSQKQDWTANYNWLNIIKDPITTPIPRR